MMDLAQLRQQDTFDYTLLLPNGDKSDIVFTLAGPTHPARAALERKLSARNLREYNRSGKTTLPDDPDDLKERAVARLVTCTLGWTNLVIDGAPLEFSPEAAAKLYADDHYGWLFSNVSAALNDTELFTRSSSRT